MEAFKIETEKAIQELIVQIATLREYSTTTRTLVVTYLKTVLTPEQMEKMDKILKPESSRLEEHLRDVCLRLGIESSGFLDQLKDLL